jgi:hypothetical protein
LPRQKVVIPPSRPSDLSIQRSLGNRSEIFLPVGFIDSLGWATVARHQLELALNFVLAALTADGGLPGPRSAAPALALLALDRPEVLDPLQSERLKTICEESLRLDQIYHDAATSVLYSRGGGKLEILMRSLSSKTSVSAGQLTLTPRRIEELTVELREQARLACDLAAEILGVGPGA